MRARTVLLVNPQAKLRAAARQLEGPGLQVIEVRNGFGALVVCAAHRVDLVLLDESAPGMDAACLARKLGGAFPDLKVESAAEDPIEQISACVGSPRKEADRAYAWAPELRSQRGA